MRVLYVNHTAEVSGSERSMLALLAALPEGVQAHVASPPGRLTRAVQELGIPVSEIANTAGSLRLHPLHTPRALGEMGLAALQVHRAARRQRADVVHANSIRAGIELGLAHVSPAAGVVHVRDCLPPGHLTTATMRVIAATATTVLANSRYTAASVRASAPGAPLEVVHPAIDLQRFDPGRVDGGARDRLGLAGRRGVLLGVVAQLSPWKGQETAIEALRLLRAEGVDAHLLLIGSAKFVARSTRFDNEAYVAHLRALIASAGIEDRVSWLGERDDVPELMRALDVLLLPSVEEPFGRVLLEAMALEVPVLATNVGGPAELIHDGREGYLLPPGEPAAWAQAVRRVIASPEHGRELGRAGRRRVAEAFDVAHHVDAVLAVYERAIARKRGG
ncbi:MAG TPA: glycosyltransferase family 4 protein [Solirubrobacteraceae bacterium]|nr:glycosyltransferase family 4 protein [Solirubrobacteraceae bacterium]